MSDTVTSAMTLIFLSYAAFLRIRELIVSKQNQKKLGEQGFTRKDGRISYAIMLVLHASFFIIVPFEIYFLPLWHNEIITIIGLALFVFSQVVRFAALRSLGKYWNTNVMTGETMQGFIASGPYQWIRHPNYLAVMLEFLTIPLIAGAWRSALLYTAWNAAVLFFRIRNEEEELFKIAGYREVMEQKKRFIPGII